MSRMKFAALGASLCLAIAALATPALAQLTYEVKPLSNKHTVYGISQFNYGDVGTDQDITLMNPGRVDHLVAVLAYARPTDLYAYHGFPGQLIKKERFDDCGGDCPDETFLACTVVHLTPHAAIKVKARSSAFPARYVETLSVPRQKVTLSDGSRGRVGDGLGTRLATTVDWLGVDWNLSAVSVPQSLADPSLFTLPDDRPFWQDEAITQQEAAFDCICAGLNSIRKLGIKPVSVFAFKEFGVDCSGGEIAP